MQTILVTGGAGYIGSHTVLQLLETDHQVIVLDNLCNASSESLRRVETLTGKKSIFVEGDIRDNTILEFLFSKHKIDSVIHFAGLKAVGESVEHPLKYYENNVYGTLTLCKAMQAHGVKNLVLSLLQPYTAPPQNCRYEKICPPAILLIPTASPS